MITSKHEYITKYKKGLKDGQKHKRKNNEKK